VASVAQESARCNKKPTSRPPLELDDEMAVSEKEFRELSRTVAELVGARNAMRWLPSAAVLFSLAALGWCWHIGNRVTAIAQHLADGGVTNLVAHLESPKSTEQLQAGLSTVIAQVQTARAEGVRPNEKKVASLTQAVSHVVQSDPNLPEAWNAATELISYRSQLLRSGPEPLAPCNLHDIKPEVKTEGSPNAVGGLSIRPGFYLSNCSLKLEDVPDLTMSAEEVPNSLVKFTGKGKVAIPLYLTDGEITYYGGPLRYSAFFFINCTFRLQANGIPDDSAQKLLIAVLNTPDLRYVNDGNS